MILVLMVRVGRLCRIKHACLKIWGNLQWHLSATVTVLQETDPAGLLPSADLLEEQTSKTSIDTPEQVKQLCKRQGGVFWIKRVYRYHNDRCPADMAKLHVPTIVISLWGIWENGYKVKQNVRNGCCFFTGGVLISGCLSWNWSFHWSDPRFEIPVKTALMTLH